MTGPFARRSILTAEMCERRFCSDRVGRQGDRWTNGHVDKWTKARRHRDQETRWIQMKNEDGAEFILSSLVQMQRCAGDDESLLASHTH
jgi:hypothetical protein